MVGNLLHFSTPNQSNIANQDRNQINVTQNASSSSERSYLQWAVLSNDILFSMLFNFFFRDFKHLNTWDICDSWFCCQALITTDKQWHNNTQSVDTIKATPVHCDTIQYNVYTINTTFQKPIMSNFPVYFVRIPYVSSVSAAYCIASYFKVRCIFDRRLSGQQVHVKKH